LILSSNLNGLYSSLAIQQLRHLKHFRRIWNPRHPQLFSEKLFNRLRWPESMFSLLADKIEMRRAVKHLVGGDYLVPLLYSGSTIDAQNLQGLPYPLVVKPSNAAGRVLFLRDENDISQKLEQIQEWTNVPYGTRSGERHYSSIRPRFLVEQMLGDGSAPPDDYKLHIFNDGFHHRYMMQHMVGRGTAVYQKFYDESWTPHRFQRHGAASYAGSIEEPKSFNEMKEVARALLTRSGYMRIDFYVIENRVYVGEMTLTPVGGSLRFSDNQANSELGKWFGWGNEFLINGCDYGYEVSTLA
jgi:hypothetical protein